MRKKDKRFKGDYTQVPRGRVFQFEDGTFVVFTGDWINNYPDVKSLILEEFDLPEDATTFKQDSDSQFMYQKEVNNECMDTYM